MALQAPLPWSTRLTIHPSSPPPSTLSGDKIYLPQSALEQLLSAASQVFPPSEEVDPWARPQASSFFPEPSLPHPLIVKLTYQITAGPEPAVRTVHAVPREFSADEGTVVLSEFLRKTLGLNQGDDVAKIDIEAASLPKGTQVRLRPLEEGYDDEDWRAILEQYMRERFATVEEGTILEVPRDVVGERGKPWRFLIDLAVPGGSICVVDTDLEVDIEPLNEEQARATLKQRIQRQSSGGRLELDKEAEGELKPGEEHFYELEMWNRELPLQVVLDGIGLEEGEDVDLFVTTDRQHHKPRVDQHVWGDLDHNFPKHIFLSPGNIELVNSKRLFIGVRSWADPSGNSFSDDVQARRYNLSITQSAISPIQETMQPEETTSAPSPDHKRCPNCTQWILSRTFFLHESFCLRHNVLCPICHAIFKRGTETSHWHCQYCSTSGNASASYDKHLSTTHTTRKCLSCPYIASSLRDLATHRTSVCPSKLILCSFCHLLVAQGGVGDGNTPDAETILSGLTRHELSCGGRTTECDRCGRRTRLRDLELHLKNHDLQRLAKPLPVRCTNPNCYRTVENREAQLGLCETCFSPLYAPNYDPTGTALRARVERKLLRQLIGGCGKSWCKNHLCITGRRNSGGDVKVDSKAALLEVKSVLERSNDEVPLCVDLVTDKNRSLAEKLWIESCADHSGSGGNRKGGFPVEFCCRAVDISGGKEEAARKWLEFEGVRVGER